MKVHGIRAMLNLPGHCSTASIVAEVEDTSDRKPGCDIDGEALTKSSSWGCAPEANLTIADCSRSISFEFGFYREDERENNLHKVDVLIDALTKFREGLVIENERYLERRAFIEAADNNAQATD